MADLVLDPVTDLVLDPWRIFNTNYQQSYNKQKDHLLEFENAQLFTFSLGYSFPEKGGPF